ncbi:hypothetical protein EYF80_054954 [Liparis tanakae]|uniref:Mitotic interactor and substrate of PLK1 n=1 Tax=Liparis tanakae TaxID=230148 RepID=A0A4Z2F294_9TELE|nr:hypothetical protein EYF80_054954 [Liparis tanakae]
METTEPRPSPQGPVSRDDCGLWMKMDPDPVTGSPLGNRREEPQDEPRARPPGAIPRYYSVMDDEVFIPPPPTHTAPVLAAEGSADAQVNDSSMTLTNEAAGATEAEDNPGGLDWHGGERRSMATRDEEDEVIVSTEQTSTASMDTTSLSKDAILPGDQDHTSMEDAGSDPTGTHHKGDGESAEEPEDVGILSEETCRESEAQKNNYPKEEPSGNSQHVTQFDEEGESEDVSGAAETDSKLTTENAECGDVETNAPAVSSDEEELCKSGKHTVDGATGQAQVQDVPAGESNGDEEHVDTRSLNYTLTKSSWVRRESGTGETRVSRLSFSGGAEEMAAKDEQGDGGRRISIGIQQGEQLLQRLQLVQLRQDVITPESPQAAEQDAQETRGGRLGTEVDEGAGTKVDEGAGMKVDEGVGTDLMAKTENNEGKDVEAKARRFSSTTPVESEPRERDSDGDRVPADLPQMDPSETSSTKIPLLSFRRRLSVDETCVERPVLQEDRHLQRAGDVVNLADDPDVLEIPFKNSILLEPNEGPDRRGGGEWPFSERKMKKEISEETQRELVLFNQGKIPGEYSKGEDRQLKETKLLFEGFQKENVEGPTRQRKPPPKGRVYPSVLERTRSLEMLSLKVCSFSRAHSFRLYRETETQAETLRPTTPTTPTGSRDATPPSLYAKRDKPAHLCRSMDSISTSVSTGDTRRESGEVIGPQESPVLRGNPFFKLRPALGLKPEVEKDIREAKEREEELQRQRCTLYGENRRSGEDGETSRDKPALVPG